jgi:hypothetical protein
MAQIQMPIEIKPDNTIVSLHNYADIHIMSVIHDFDSMKPSLPNIPLIEQIHLILENTKVDVDVDVGVDSRNHHVHDIDHSVQVVVERADIKRRLRQEYHNSSFKRKGVYNHRKTNKLRPSILVDKVVDSAQSPTGQA